MFTTASTPEVGATYRHFKGNRYKVIAIATHTEDKTTMVIYHNVSYQGKSKRIDAKPLDKWNEPTPDGKPRFVKERA